MFNTISNNFNVFGIFFEWIFLEVTFFDDLVITSKGNVKNYNFLKYHSINIINNNPKNIGTQLILYVYVS